ncbi:NADPH:quinone oxidoreductase family protein [Sphingobium subterraneum]|uniref:NADPH:quinone reductase-like Zn-dependent oxidoreductase n=1 Tax=Sphingobium subterraneum TaxID=627688 RepID=A0A841J132_9SPHN|nr:NADPH:quinone oxidoreductase family protein [Sphingobium subterraneum]MBB6122385.1 NADPH:quinone reductase-like Zn-dependent oxidoreductase [Sphingobium subterraneum]
MKALLSVKSGGPETLELTEVPTPEPGKGQLRVRVLACALNFPDVLIIEDKYQFKPERPFAPGAEISGEVDAVGEGVTGWAVGDRLIAVIVPNGGLAEQVIVTAEAAIPMPKDADPVEGAALIFTYGTTIHALMDRGKLKAGETLLILGAAGGIGLSAIEIGKALGATVVAAVSSEDKAAAAREAGADRTLIYGRAPFDKDASRALAKAFKDAVGPEGAHVIYDPVGGDYAEPALRSIAWEGRYLVVGFPAGIPKIPLNLTLLKACDVRGVFWGAFMEREPERHRRHVDQLLAWWSEGQIRPRIDRVYDLADGGAAITRLASRSAIGKVVVKVASD